MFICQSCNHQQPSNVGVETVILETRRAEYPMRFKLNGAGERVQNDYGEDIVIDRGGSGTEIVRELKTCLRCAARYAHLKLAVVPQATV